MPFDEQPRFAPSRQNVAQVVVAVCQDRLFRPSSEFGAEIAGLLGERGLERTIEAVEALRDLPTHPPSKAGPRVRSHRAHGSSTISGRPTSQARPRSPLAERFMRTTSSGISRWPARRYHSSWGTSRMCCAHIQRWPSKSSAPVVPVTIRLVLRLGQDGGSRSLGPIEVLVDVVHVHEQTIDDV